VPTRTDHEQFGTRKPPISAAIAAMRVSTARVLL
jgi:hypothetical protein